MLALRFAVLLSLALLLFIGCKSADELYTEGQDLEIQGGHEAAALRYADALEKQPNLQKARGRLLEAGKIAVGQRLTRIEEAEDGGAWVEAADLHHGLDHLVGRAEDVGVTLPLPEDYAEQRRANFEAAVTTLLNEGDAEIERGDFASAISKYDRARGYEPTREDNEALALASADAYVAWSHADAAQGRFRSAYDHAGQALAFVPPGSAVAAQIVRLQTEALDLGGIRTALTPITRAADLGRDLPRGFLDALNDELEIERWTRPPPFVLVIEPALVRRALRDRGLAREPLRPREASDLGRDLDVDAVFAGEIDRFRRDVEEKKREERTARTQGGDRVTYLRIEDEVTLSAGVAFAIVDVQTRRTICEREVERSVRKRVARGEYGGNLRTLDLSRDERRLFDADESAVRERELEDELLDALTERVAEAAYECVLQGVR